MTFDITFIYTLLAIPVIVLVSFVTLTGLRAVRSASQTDYPTNHPSRKGY